MLARGASRGSAAMVVLAATVCGCGEDTLPLQTGVYTRVITAVAEDRCQLAGAVGSSDSNYGLLTVSSMQVAHTAGVQTELYMRAGNRLTRDQQRDVSGTGDCVIAITLHESGSVTAANTIDLSRNELHRIRSGTCSGVLD